MQELDAEKILLVLEQYLNQPPYRGYTSNDYHDAGMPRMETANVLVRAMEWKYGGNWETSWVNHDCMMLFKGIRSKFTSWDAEYQLSPVLIDFVVLTDELHKGSDPTKWYGNVRFGEAKNALKQAKKQVKMKQQLLVACKKGEIFFACNLLGEERVIDAELLTEVNEYSLTVRVAPKNCGIWRLPILESSSYAMFQHRIRMYVGRKGDMYIDEIRPYVVKVADMEAMHELVLQGDGRIKCRSSMCKSRNHFKCKHAQFVNMVVPSEVYSPSFDKSIDYSDLIDKG